MNGFFFAPESPRPAAMMRIGLGLVLLYDAAAHWPFVIELYSADGLPLPLFAGTGFSPLAAGATPTVVLYSALLFALTSVVLGWNTRFSLCAAAVLTAWFGLLDSPSTFAKYSVISLHLLLLLIFCESAAVWSIDRAIRSRRGIAVRLSPVWPRRLMQVLLCSVYVGAAVTKIRMPDFATGDLLMFSLLDDRWGGGYLGLWLSTQPKLLLLASILTVLFEIVLPVLIWVPRARLTMLACAAAFHIAIGLLMTVKIFTPVMLVALLAFTNEADFQRLGRLRQVAVRRLRHLVNVLLGLGATGGLSASADSPRSTPNRVTQRDVDNVNPTVERPSAPASGHKRPLLDGVLFVFVAAIWIAVGVAIQYQADWYGVFHKTVAGELPPVADADVDEMLAEQLPAYEDYFHRVEIGSRISNFHVFGARHRFRPGMILHVLGRLVQNHPPMQIEVLLIAPDGQEVARSTHQLAESYSHLMVPIRLTDELPTGRYRVLLRADGYEVAQKAFQLVPSKTTN